MPSHVLVGLSGPAQAASDAKPPKDVKDARAKGSRKLGVRRLLKLVFLAVTISAVGLSVWFLQPSPMIMGLVHTVTSKASTLSVPGVSDTPQEQAQAEATSSAPTSPTPNADESTSSVPDVHPPTVEAAARLARSQARSRAASGPVASARTPPARATTAPARATTATPSETKSATVPADPSDGATVSASTAGVAATAADPPPVPAPAAARQAAAPPQSRTAPAAHSRTAAAAAQSPLYSSTDADVAPPRPILQQKLGGIVGAIDAGAEVTIEFVVDEFGYVESAKAKSVPRSVGESVLMATGLHAIKSWRFQPAEKNGQPVRYRNSISFGAY